MRSMGNERGAIPGRVAAVLAAAVLLVSACGGSASSPSVAASAPASVASSAAASTAAGGTLNVVVADYTTDSDNWWKNTFVPAFQQKTGITVNLQVMSWADIHQKVASMVQTGQAPDILNIDTYANYAEQGLLLPVSSVISPATQADIVPALLKSGEYNGTGYAMPIIASSNILYYNTDLFTKAGISGPPTSWADIQADAQKISALPGGYIGYAMQLGPQVPQTEWSVWQWAGGGDYKTNGAWSLNTPANVATLSFMSDLANKYKVTEVNPGKTNMVDGTWPLFIQGKAGMVIGNPAVGHQIATKATGVKWAAVPFPSMNAGGKGVVLGIADYIMAFKQKTDNTAAVKQFLDAFYAQQAYGEFAKLSTLLPATTSGAATMSSDPNLKPFIDALAQATFTPAQDPGWDKVLGAMKTYMGLGLQGTSATDTLNQVQTAIGN